MDEPAVLPVQDHGTGVSVGDIDAWLVQHLSSIPSQEGIGPDFLSGISPGILGLDCWLDGSLEQQVEVSGPKRKEVGRRKKVSGPQVQQHVTGHQTSKLAVVKEPRRTARGGSDRKRQSIRDLESQVRQQLQQLTLLQRENEEVKHKNDVLQKAIAIRDGHLQLLSQGLLPSFDKWVLLSAEVDLKQWTGEDLRGYWRQLVGRFSALLVDEVNQVKMSTKVEQEIADLFNEAVHVTNILGLLNPTPMYYMDTIHIESGAKERPPPEFWGPVASSLGLSADQKRLLLQCYDLFLKEEKKVTDEKQQLVQQLHALVNSQSLPLVVESLHHHEGALRVLHQLQANLQRATSITHFFNQFCEIHAVEPIQLARCCIASYPYAPDTFGILKYIVEEGEQGSRHPDDSDESLED